MLALVENSVTESLLCSQTAHLAHRSLFDESRPGHHGGKVIYFGKAQQVTVDGPLFGLEDDCGGV